MTILWLDQQECADPARTGGKAAALASLAASFPVPPGFCLTVDAFQGLSPEASADRFDAASVTTIERAYADLGERCGVAEPRVAVRSSAVDEDGAAASFAGVYQSHLNIQGPLALVRAIARCRAAAADPRVLAYRAERGLDRAGIAVLVQVLIEADAAAVAFSANPVSGATDEIVINANYGLGESVVSGLVNPDTWVLGKPDLDVRRFKLGDKARMTIRSDDGTREVPVLQRLRQRPCLGTAEITAIGRLVLRLESATDRPVDVECAFAADHLALLQCRPITAGTSR